MKKLLTIDDLFSFCMKNNFTHFSSKKDGSPLIIHDIGNFETNSDEPVNGQFKVQLKACHTLLNRNNSFISEETMLKALPSFANRPILGHIIETENGMDFDSHNMEIVEDKWNEGEERIHYIERGIGTIPESCNARLVSEEGEDKKFVLVDGLIYTDYGNGAYEIMKAKGSTKVSVELAINEMSFNAKEKYLVLEDFYFNGVTALGDHVGEGMLGSKMTINSFSKEQNSLFEKTCGGQEKMIEVLDKLNTTLSNFNINKTTKEGGTLVTKFEELLEQYNKTLEDIDFEYETMSDEELEIKFSELFDEENATDEGEEGDDTKENGDDPDALSEEDNDSEFETNKDDEEKTDGESVSESDFSSSKTCSFDESGNMTITMAVSHEDTRCALYNLLSSYESVDNEWYLISNVYDKYFVYENWSGTKVFKQEYGVDNDIVSFNGDRSELFKELLSATEKAALEDMRKNYATLVDFEKQVKESELNSKREEVLSAIEYSILAENEDFKSLAKDMEKYSIEELQIKADVIFAKHVKTTQEFSLKDETRTTHKVSFGQDVEKEKKPYGSLFDKK